MIAEVAHVRRAPGHADGRTVAALLVDERERLLPLPQHPLECDRLVAVSSGKTPYVRFDVNDYSIPHRLVRKPLALVASETTIRILDGLDQVATHPRSYDRGAVVEDPTHIEQLARDKRRAHDLRGRDLVRTTCKNSDAVLEALSSAASRWAVTARLLKLLARYGAAELDRALAEGLARGAVGAPSIAHILDQRARGRRVAPPLEAVLPDDPRVRDLHVTPHELGRYDDLYADEDEPR